VTPIMPEMPQPKPGRIRKRTPTHRNSWGGPRWRFIPIAELRSTSNLTFLRRKPSPMNCATAARLANRHCNHRHHVPAGIVRSHIAAKEPHSPAIGCRLRFIT
jgi:hypothetical protein